MRIRRVAAAYVILVLLGQTACESAADRAIQRASQEEARLYGDQAARLQDEHDRTMESLHVTELRHLVENQRALLSRIRSGEEKLRNRRTAPAAANEFNERHLAEDRERPKKNVAALNEKRAEVEAQRDRLIQLEKATQALLKAPKADAGVGEGVLVVRLKGIQVGLAAANAALADAEKAMAEGGDGG